MTLRCIGVFVTVGLRLKPNLKPWAVTSTQQAPAAAPVVRQVVLDCPHARVLAEFYRQLIGLDSGDAQEPLFVLADPPGHPFCIVVSA